VNAALAPNLLSRIEDAGLNASAPPQQRWIDGWLVRFSPGKAKRARCVNAVAAGRLPVGEKLARCEDVYHRAGLPMFVRITPFSLPAGLDAHLGYLGFHAVDDTRVMVLADLDGAAARSPDGAELRDIPLDAFAHRVGAFRGSPLAQRQAHVERLASSPVPFFACELLVDGESVACGQMALEDDLVGLYDIFTAPAARGRGHAETVCRHLLAEGQRRGARHAYLQVDADNAPARAVYHRLGFTDGYAYHYRCRDAQAV
jgi:ribosomal protein S18 acetylase RimI-like enzyme